MTSGNTYVVPATVPNWTITSWSTHARVGGGMLAMKVYRPVGGTSYLVVGHDGPHTLTPDVLNTFQANVAVKAGDVLGNSAPPAVGSAGCYFSVSGESYLVSAGNLADGESGNFTVQGNSRRLNVSAVINPSNAFMLGKVKRNKRKGTATLTVNVPNPGELALSGKGLKRGAKTVTAPGDVKLKLRPKARKKRTLDRMGKAKVRPNVTFTPTGGDPSSQLRSFLKLKKR